MCICPYFTKYTNINFTKVIAAKPLLSSGTIDKPYHLLISLLAGPYLVLYYFRCYQVVPKTVLNLWCN